jgi:hypothetical protein
VGENHDPNRVLGDRQVSGHRHRTGAHPDFLVAYWRVARRGGGRGLGKTLPGAIEQRDHLIVGGLGEIAVTLTHGKEERGRV